MIDGHSQADIFPVAYAAFCEEWTSLGMPEPTRMTLDQVKEFSPRTPMQAAEMILGYMEARATLIRRSEIEVIDVEKPFAVPLDPSDPTLFYVGKIDKVISHRGDKYRGMEHKSTTAYQKTESEKVPFKRSFLESFSPNTQVDGYLYAMHLYYPGKAGGVWIDAALVHKEKEGFTLIPVERQMQQLELWLWEARSSIDQIEENIKAAEATASHDRYMAAFGRDTRSCHNQYGYPCTYLAQCKAWANPVGKEMPRYFHHEPWDPLRHLDKGRLKIGETDEA